MNMVFEKKESIERSMAHGERANQEKTDRMDEVQITGRVHYAQSECNLLIEPHRRELLLHCYRLLGSLHDAEDAVQETMLRAWRHFDTFTEKGPGSLRNWLYTIATNVSLDLLKKHSPRTLPTSASSAWDPLMPVAPRTSETLWLEPFLTVGWPRRRRIRKHATAGTRAFPWPFSSSCRCSLLVSEPFSFSRMCFPFMPLRSRACLRSRSRQ